MTNRNKKVQEYLPTAQAESKRNFYRGNAWTLRAKRYGYYLGDLYTLLGSTLDAKEVNALHDTYHIDLGRLFD